MYKQILLKIAVVIFFPCLFLSACGKDANKQEMVTGPEEEITEQADNDTVNEEDAGTAFPDTDIYLARLLFKSGLANIGEPDNITNRTGYDNQPFFMPDNDTILFSSRHAQDQTDIYAYRISSKQIQKLTDTPESEYSPTLTPGKKTASTVRVEMDGTQRLWEFPIAAPLGGITANSENFEVVFPEVQAVGYHGWFNEETAYLFIVDAQGEKHKLAKASRDMGGADTLTNRIGRSIRKIPDSNNMSFIAKDNPQVWYVLELNPETGESRVLTETMPGSEDLVWLDKSNLLMASGNRIYHKNLESGQDWKAISANSMGSVAGDVTRLAVSADRQWLAFVVTQPVE